MNKKRVWIILGSVVVLGIAGFALSRAMAPATSAQGTTAQLGRVTQATLSQTVDSSGSVTPESEVTLGFGASGVVSRVNVELGGRAAGLKPIEALRYE